MSAKKHVKRQHNKALYLSLISVAHTCIIQFFPLYLKHLNLAAFEVGLIRACQIWLSVLLLPIWLSLAKRLRSTCWKKVIFCVFLFLIINTNFCLIFMPLSNKLEDVTHCHTNRITISRKDKASTAHSIQDHYTLSNIQVPSRLHKKLNHKLPDISSEGSITDVRNKSALDYIGKYKSNSKYSHGSKNISNQNYVNNFLLITETPLFSERLNETKGDNESTLNIELHKSSGRTNTNYFNYSSTDNLKEFVSKLKAHNLSDIQKIQKSITKFKKTNHSNLHQDQSNHLFSIHKNKSIHDTANITKLFSEESSTSFSTVSTEFSFDSEYNKNSNFNLNYDDSSVYHISQNNKKKIGNIFNSYTDYDQKFPVSSADINLDTSTQESENIAVDNSESRIEDLSDINREDDMSYHIYHQKQVINPLRSGSVHHKINRNNNNRISSHADAARRGYVGKSDSDFEPSDSLQENNIDSYRKFSIIKPSLKNENVQNVNAQYKEEENSVEENEETRDWQILKTLLKKQRQKRSMERKKHHRMKRHHHHASNRKFHHKTNNFEERHVQELNSFGQYSSSVNIREKMLKEGKTIRNPRTSRRLMFVDESDEEIDKSSDSEVKKVHISLLNHDQITKELIKVIIKSKIENILSLTFGTILLLAILTEVFSRAVISTSNQALIYNDKIGGSLHLHIIGYQKEDSQQIWTLITWGIFGCPTIALLVLFTECSYQPRAFLVFSTALIGMAMLLVLFFLQFPEAVWDWKLKDCGEEFKQRSTSFLKRFGYNVSIFVAAFAMACNSEFILWYMSTLNGFPYNYQLLYCGYIGIGAIFQAVVKSWLLRKQIRIQDFSNPDVDIVGGDGVRSIGPILLGLHFLAASILQPAWSLLFLGVLQGCSAAFLVSARISGCWAAGYGLGCVTGGFMVNLHSADRLFWIMAGSMFVWSAMVTLSRGLLKCIGNTDRDRASYSQLLLLGEESDKEDMTIEEEEDEEDDDDDGEEECNGDDDWLERALQKDEQEAQRRRIMSCPT